MEENKIKRSNSKTMKEKWKDKDSKYNSLEYRLNMSKSKKGKRFTKEHKEKLSILAKERIKRGIAIPPLQHMRAKDNPNWRGDKIGYSGIHLWIRRNKPKPEFCEICNKNIPREVANVNGIYDRDILNYKWLCKKCHRNFDLNKNKLGITC
jgi:hypothetical protein